MQNSFDNNSNNFWDDMERRQNRGRFVGGIALIILGTIFLLRQLGIHFPSWIFSWENILIAIGLYIGFKSNFKNNASWILIAIGAFFLLDDFYAFDNIRKYFWSVFLIVIGSVILLRSSKKKHLGSTTFNTSNTSYNTAGATTTNDADVIYDNEEYLNITTAFGGERKNIISKNFKGGDISAAFGGCEINLMNADFNGTITIHTQTFFGGTKLIVPNNWQIKSELTTILGGVDDNRVLQPQPLSHEVKIVLLKGTLFCGGLEIKSY